MMLDKRTFILGVLSLSAIVLVAANMLAPRYVSADTTIRDLEYQLQTGRLNGGGEALYVTENRSGMMAAIVYNPNRKTFDVVSVKAVTDTFKGAGGPPARGAR